MIETTCTCIDCDGCFPENIQECPWCRKPCTNKERLKDTEEKNKLLIKED